MINLLSFCKYAQNECQLGISYMHIFQKTQNQKNNLSYLNPFASVCGIYYFVNYHGDVLYIGEAHIQSLKDRISQHFQEGTGGLRYKLRNSPSKLRELEDSMLFVFPIEKSPEEIKDIEAALVKLYQPPFNDNLK